MDNNVDGSSSSREIATQNVTTTNTGVSLNNVVSNQVLLATALVNVEIAPNQYVTARCLLDSASQVSFITTSLFSKLRLKSFKRNTNVFGISGNQTVIYNYTTLSLSSIYDNTCQFKENCAVIDEITLPLPHTYINVKKFNLPSNIMLADNSFNTPGHIDILLGASV